MHSAKLPPHQHVPPPIPPDLLIHSETEYGAERQDKRAGMAADALQVWRERLGACYGLDVHTPAPVQNKIVLILDRPYEAGGWAGWMS